MARRTVVTLIDDLDGGTADETVDFALDGTGLRIDLSTANAAALRAALRPYLEAARKATSRRPARRRAATSNPISQQAVRAWAAANNVAVAPKGRISAAVVAEFREAGN